MKAKDVAKLLLQHPEMEVEVGVYAYRDPEDSIGTFEFTDVETISLRKTGYMSIVLTGEKIGYPLNSGQC